MLYTKNTFSTFLDTQRNNSDFFREGTTNKNFFLHLKNNITKKTHSLESK